MRRTVIVNPAAGNGRTAGRWQHIVAELERSGEEFDVRLTSHAGHAMELTRDAVTHGSRSVVVLGGDGTIGEIVAGCVAADGASMLADDIDIAIIHQGTGGDLARGLDIPKDEVAAVAVALRGASATTRGWVAGCTQRLARRLTMVSWTSSSSVRRAG